MSSKGKDGGMDKEDRFERSASTGQEKGDAEDISGIGKMPKTKASRGQVKTSGRSPNGGKEQQGGPTVKAPGDSPNGGKEQQGGPTVKAHGDSPNGGKEQQGGPTVKTPGDSSSGREEQQGGPTVKTPGDSPSGGEEQQGGEDIESKRLQSMIVDKLSSITYDQWIIVIIGVLVCLCAWYFNSEIQTLKQSSKSIDSSPSINIVHMDERLQSVINDLSSLKPRFESLEKSQEDMLKELKDFETKTNKQMSESVGKLEDHSTRTDKIYTALHERLGTIDETTSNLTQELVVLKRTFELYTTNIRDEAEEMSLRLKKADTELEKFQTNMKTMTTKLANHDKDLNTAFRNLFNKEAAIIVIVLILTINIGLVCSVCVLCKGRNRTGGISANTLNPNTDGDSYYNPVLDKIPVRPVLRKAVCVISFSRQHQDLHKHLVESLKDGILQHIDVVYHVILKTEDIINIPHCSLIIICIEYSARDVIIELEGFALGDRNKTTLKAVQKLGAIPVIVYDYDHRSQRLGANKIFSEQIGCATRQEELIPLSQANRFYSVYDSFSPHQKQVLQATIQTHVLN